MKHSRTTRAAAGFTLVELMVIMLILGILGAIVVFSVGSLEGSSAAATCKADFKTVETAQEAYRGEVGTSATSFASLTSTAIGLNGTQVGPWLKDIPSTGHGYVLGFDPASGDITVASISPAHPAADGNTNCQYA